MASQTVRLTPSACAGCLQLVSTLVQLQLTMHSWCRGWTAPPMTLPGQQKSRKSLFWHLETQKSLASRGEQWASIGAMHDMPADAANHRDLGGGQLPTTFEL